MPSGVAHGDGVYHHEAVIHVSESLLGPEVCAPDLGAYEFNGQDWTAGASIGVPDSSEGKKG